MHYVIQEHAQKDSVIQIRYIFFDKFYFVSRATYTICMRFFFVSQICRPQSFTYESTKPWDKKLTHIISVSCMRYKIKIFHTDHLSQLNTTYVKDTNTHTNSKRNIQSYLVFPIYWTRNELSTSTLYSLTEKNFVGPTNRTPGSQLVGFLLLSHSAVIFHYSLNKKRTTPSVSLYVAIFN